MYDVQHQSEEVLQLQCQSVQSPGGGECFEKWLQGPWSFKLHLDAIWTWLKNCLKIVLQALVAGAMLVIAGTRWSDIPSFGRFETSGVRRVLILERPSFSPGWHAPRSVRQGYGASNA